MTMQATITGPGRMITEHPFRHIFVIDIKGDVINAALVGHKGQVVAKAMRQGDVVEVEGHFIKEKTFGKIFIIEHMTLPEEAKIGRNLNRWG